MEANTAKAKKAALSSTGPAYLKTFYSTPEATYFLKSLIEMSDDSFLNASVADIESTIADIEARL